MVPWHALDDFVDKHGESQWDVCEGFEKSSVEDRSLKKLLHDVHFLQNLKRCKSCSTLMSTTYGVAFSVLVR